MEIELYLKLLSFIIGVAVYFVYIKGQIKEKQDYIKVFCFMGLVMVINGFFISLMLISGFVVGFLIYNQRRTLSALRQDFCAKYSSTT